MTKSTLIPAGLFPFSCLLLDSGLVLSYVSLFFDSRLLTLDCFFRALLFFDFGDWTGSILPVTHHPLRITVFQPHEPNEPNEPNELYELFPCLEVDGMMIRSIRPYSTASSAVM